MGSNPTLSATRQPMIPAAGGGKLLYSLLAAMTHAPRQTPAVRDEDRAKRVVVDPDQVFQSGREPAEPGRAPRSLRSHLGEFLAISFVVVIGLVLAAVAITAILT